METRREEIPHRFTVYNGVDSPSLSHLFVSPDWDTEY